MFLFVMHTESLLETKNLIDYNNSNNRKTAVINNILIAIDVLVVITCNLHHCLSWLILYGYPLFMPTRDLLY